MASLLRRIDDLRRIRARNIVLQNTDGSYPGNETVLRIVSDQGDVGNSGVLIDNSNNLFVPGSVSIGDNLDISGDLDVVGSAAIGGDLDVSGALEVVGDGRIGGDLDVSGALDVVGNGLIGGNLDVSGALDVVGGGVIGGNLDVSGALEVVGNGLIGGNLDVSGALEVVGNGLIGGNLDVSGALEVVGNGLIGGDLDVSGALDVVGGGRIGGDLDVSGALEVVGGGLIGGNLDVSGALDVSGDVRSNNGLSSLSSNAPNVGTCEIYSLTNDTVGPQFQAYKSRGATGAVQNSDQLGFVNFFGMDAGANYGLAAAQIRASAAQTFTDANNHATDLTFAVREAGGSSVTDRMTIQSDGAVELTSSKLAIFGDTSTAMPLFALNNSQVGGVLANDELGRIVFIGRNADNSYPFASARISGFSEITGTTDGNHPGYLTFWTSPPGDDNNFERMRITSVGNVGIGTSTPAATLDVNGGARFGTGATITVIDTSGNLTVPGTITAGAITFGFQSV